MDLVLGSAYNDFDVAQICYMDGPLRFTDKSINQNEQLLFNNWWSEILNTYGQKVDYFISNFSLSAQDGFYGEDTISGYSIPTPIIMGVSISNDSVLLSRFGIQATTDFTALVHISGFKAIFGPDAEPKSDDLVRLTEFGNDRPGGRTGAIYQITSRDDEEVSQINQLAGHFVWIIRGKRYDYTWEHNSARETVMDQVYDTSFAGLLSGTMKPSISASDIKKYDTSDVDSDAKNIFDYNTNGVNTSPYGNY